MKFRPDIEGLRALAIAPVVAFHAWPALLPGGFVGVDVFFVISGYLITSLLLQRLADGRYSVTSFYAARIRRIFPALFVMLAAVAPLSWLLLSPQALGELARVLGATGVFLSNFELYRTTGYFEGATDLKPLVHTWSLAVEEQYYIVFPLLLAALHRWARPWLAPALGVIGLASLAYSQWLIGHDGALAFYSALSRTFELMVGSLLAVRAAGRFQPLPGWAREGLGALGLVGIALSCALLRADSPFPGLTALGPCLAAAALIEAGQGEGSRASRLLALKPLRWLGALSFSLYLWHWPVLVFTRHVLLGHPDAWQAAVAVALSVGLAWASLRWVEAPVRQATWGERRFLLLGVAAIALSSAVAVAGMAVARWDAARATPANRLYAAAADHDPHRERCHVRERVQSIDYAKRCVVGPADAPHQLTVWGDSHGIEIGRALSEHLPPDRSLALLTAAACPPAQDFMPPGRNYCPPHNQRVLEALVADARVDRVLIISRSRSYVASADMAAAFEQGLAASVRRLKQAGKQVWLLDPIPGYDYPVPAATAQRLRRGQDPNGFGQTVEHYRHDNAAALALLRRVAQATGAELIAVQDSLCTGPQCDVVTPEGQGLYIDDNHLSMAGARRLAQQALWPRLSAPDASR